MHRNGLFVWIDNGCVRDGSVQQFDETQNNTNPQSGSVKMPQLMSRI
jgi:hypothetical protein